VLDRHADELKRIKRAYDDLVSRTNPGLERLAKRYAKSVRKIADRFNTLQETLAQELEEEAPDPGEVNWPEPEEGDEDPDPLFDSTRGYLEQIDRYKEHQDKSTVRRKGVRGGTGWKVGRKRGPMSEEQKEARRRTWAHKLGKEAAP